MRKIIHVDMDCFYAAVEMRDNPSLQNKPVAVGGTRVKRGVIATCNYQARQFGVHSAMPTSRALALCPSLILIAGRMDVYRQISQQIRGIFERYTSEIEPLSLDEAYLDVSDSQMCSGSATLIAQEIREAIRRETGLTASAGVASCKFVAKIASDENKPDGICIVPPEQQRDFILKQPLQKIPGVGKVTLGKLQAMGLHSCADVCDYPFAELAKVFGKFASCLWQRCHGIDERSVKSHRERKSVGAEITLPSDIHAIEQCHKVLEELLPRVWTRLKCLEASQQVSAVGIKMKFSDFTQTTVEQRSAGFLPELLPALLVEAHGRRRDRGIRLLGIHVSLKAQSKEQLVLSFD